MSATPAAPPRSMPEVYPARRLIPAAWCYAVGMTLHGSDHLRRGLRMNRHDHAAWPGRVHVLLAGVTVAIAVFAVLVARSGHRLAPAGAAIIGLGSAATFLALHLAPGRGHVVDTFVDPMHGAQVGAWSWLTVFLGVSGCLMLGVAGLRALWQRP